MIIREDSERIITVGPRAGGGANLNIETPQAGDDYPGVFCVLTEAETDVLRDSLNRSRRYSVTPFWYWLGVVAVCTTSVRGALLIVDSLIGAL